ncbi:SDR family NAD(P)-dependent oxidoreductase [Streptomyces sp. NPDC057695]|uniref:SDR family NAD(P)-dependent oxidoreductase n=1 Tax=Streptomyces sp. NPDC057695 TaxID=3346217 RepID=UPI00369E3661
MVVDSGTRALVVGATGSVGGLAAEALTRRGATTALAGRDPERLASRAERLGGRPHRGFEAYDLAACEGLAPWAHEALGGLDAVVVAVGVAGFSPAADVPEPVAEHLMTVNAQAPMAVVRGALRVLPAGGAVSVVTGVIVDRPLLGTADYAASKTALATWLAVVGREARRAGISVLDVRMPHLDNGFAQRPAIGSPPSLPEGEDTARAVEEHLIAPLVARLGEGA